MPAKRRDDWSRKPIALQVRGSPEWKAWVEELADFCRQPVAGLVDAALAEKARRIGFLPPPPKR